MTRTRITCPTGTSPLFFVLIGMLEPGVAYYLEFVGLQHTTALHTALILTLEPVGILIFNLALFHFRRDLPLMLAAAGASLGTLITVLGWGGEGDGSSLHGDALVLVGTMAASLYVSLSTRLLQSGSVISLLLIQQLSSLIFVILVSAAQWPQPSPWRFSGLSLASAATVGALQFALAFLFYFQGVKRSSGYWSVVVLNLAPLVGIAASVILLNERLTLFYIAGGLLCLGASFYTKLREHALEQQPAKTPERAMIQR